MAPIAELANKAFSAFEKYQQLQDTGKADLSLAARSNKVKPTEKTPGPANLANVLMKFMKFKNGIQKKNSL